MSFSLTSCFSIGAVLTHELLCFKLRISFIVWDFDWPCKTDSHFAHLVYPFDERLGGRFFVIGYIVALNFYLISADNNHTDLKLLRLIMRIFKCITKLKKANMLMQIANNIYHMVVLIIN